MLYRTSSTAPVFGLRREIDRLFEDTFGRGDGGTSWTPAVDIRESQNELQLDVELPGLNPDDVEITANNGILSVHIPKSALPQPKKIQIKAGQPSTGQRQVGNAGTQPSGQRRVNTGDQTTQQQTPMAASSKRDSGAKS